MPELPEVETIKRTLAPKIQGKKITDVEVFCAKAIEPLSDQAFRQAVEGAFIQGLERRGKYLLMHLYSMYTLVISLRMTGRLIFIPCGEEVPVDKHVHLVFKFEDGSHLCFSDIRKFGRVHCVPKDKVEHESEISKLGPEPLEQNFSEQKLRKMLLPKRKKIKQLLMDQTFIAGIGNIYADEILFRAGIHPETLPGSLLPEQVHDLYLSIVAVLSEAIVQKGTTFRDYVDGEGNAGNYQYLLQVYGRKGKKCYHCGQQLESIKLGGRTSCFCPACQTRSGC